MLVITRKQNESLVIGDGITITVVDIRGDKVRLGVTSPPEVPIHRQEVHNALVAIRRPQPRVRPPEEQAFFQAVLETPDDEGIRLIFADWLEDHNDPFGEFIRLQCALAKLPPDDERRGEMEQREQELWDQHGETWLEYLPDILRSCVFERGFVETVSLTVADFLTHANEIFAAAPLRRLRVRLPWATLPRASVAALVGSVHLARLAEVDLSELGLRDAEASLLASSPHTTSLRGLVLRGNRIQDEGAAALAKSPYLADLHRLDISGNQLGPGGVALLQDRFGERVRF